MNENRNRQESSGEPHSEQEVLTLLRKIQQQLSFLERKIDAMGGSRPSPRPFNNGRYPSRPRRPFGRPHRQGGDGRGPGSGQSHFSKPNYHGRPREEERQGSSQNKKPFSQYRKNKHKSNRKTDHKPF